jgi:glutathione S-transferase
MLQIFHIPRTRSLRILWLAEEMGLPYEIRAERLGRPSAELLAANPSGKIPTIRDGATVMRESTAILHYLTQIYGPTPLALAPGQDRYADYVQFLVFGEASMAAPLNPVLRTLFSAPKDQKQNFTVDAAKDGFRQRLKDLEVQLDKGDYMAGDFSAADISVGYALGLGAALGLDADYSPAVQAYFARLQARPAFQAAAAK